MSKKNIKWGSLTDFSLDELSELTQKKLGSIDGGKNSGLNNAKNINGLKTAGKISAKKQWSENRDELLKRSKKGGDKCKEEQKGIFKISKENLGKQGEKGYANGLGKLSKKEKSKISKKAGLVSRDKNSKLKPEDVKYARKVFIPHHPEFGVVPLSKKFGVTEDSMRKAIKGRSFKDI